VKEALAETRTPKITLAFGNFRSNNGITTSGRFAQVSRIVNTVHLYTKIMELTIWKT